MPTTSLGKELESRAKEGKFFVGIIDGTGPNSDDSKGKEAYDAAMKPGFCHQIKATFGKEALYMRGPDVFGSGLSAAVNEVVKAADNHSNSAIILVGYSRGALGILMAADQLRQKGVVVYALVLLDAVDRYGASSPYKSVPNNVLYSFRAYRTLSAKIILKYEGTMSSAPKGWSEPLKNFADIVAPSNPIRPSFSSTGMGVERGGLYDASIKDQHQMKHYVGSHGAMGGVGYHWVSEDETCQADLIRDLSKWLSGRLKKPVKLVQGWDPELTSPKFSGVARAIVAAGAAATDLALMGVANLDALIYDVKESFRK